jgi:hypothetical protein
MQAQHIPGTMGNPCRHVPLLAEPRKLQLSSLEIKVLYLCA